MEALGEAVERGYGGRAAVMMSVLYSFNKAIPFQIAADMTRTYHHEAEHLLWLTKQIPQTMNTPQFTTNLAFSYSHAVGRATMWSMMLAAYLPPSSPAK